MGTTLRGRFRPTNPAKYRGDPSNIIYRSSWEFDMMKWLDKREDVVWWASEERCVWYTSPVTKKKHRYFPDFIVHYIKEGVARTEVIEIKPSAQVKGPPRNPKRRTKAWAKSVETYMINLAKWKAAELYCEDRGWDWRILTEDSMPSWKKRK